MLKNFLSQNIIFISIYACKVAIKNSNWEMAKRKQSFGPT